MSTVQEEFEPFEQISQVVKFWWVIFLCGVLGGAAGLIVHSFKAPIYETQAVFMASIDFNKVNIKNLPKANQAPYQFTQYDEDISLVVVESSLRTVEPQVVKFAQQNGLKLTVAGLESISTIERKHAYWELRFRSPDPVLAQNLVNYWAQTGFADLKARQTANKLPPYVFFDLVSLAELPKTPAYFQTNVFVLAGIVIGLVAGLILVNLPFMDAVKKRPIPNDAARNR
jgi:uncharacterized protein involved in exopolysaccharide biosynthesis